MKERSIVLKENILARIEGLDKGNFVDIKLAEDVEARIAEIETKLMGTIEPNMRNIEFSYESLRSIFDIIMSNKTHMPA